MRRYILALLSAALVLAAASPVVAAQDVKAGDVTITIKVGDEKKKEGGEQKAAEAQADEKPKAAVEKEKPWYFGHIIKADTPLRQYEELGMASMRSWNKFQNNVHGPWAYSFANSIRVQTNIPSTCTGRKEPVPMVLVLHHYERLPDGKVRVTHYDGEEIITERQLQVVIDHLVERVNTGADANQAFYKDLEPDAVRYCAESLDYPVEKLRERLEREAPDFKGVTWREMLKLPRPSRRSDHVPEEFHFSLFPYYDGILGAVYLNTGKLWYNPLADIHDEIDGRPLVYQHEAVHCNANLQSLPYSEGFDVELFASVPMMLYDEGQISFFLHGYVWELRELAHIHFGFNFDEARKRLVPFNYIGNLLVDEKAFNEVYARVREIQAEYRKVMPKVVRTYYSNPVFWWAVHHKAQDDNFVVRVVMAGEYDMTILGDGGDAKEDRKKTMQWLKARHDKIEGYAKQAWANSGEGENRKRTSGPAAQPPAFLVRQYRAMFNPEQREKLEQYFRDHPEELEQLQRDFEKLGMADLFRVLKKAGIAEEIMMPKEVVR